MSSGEMPDASSFGLRGVRADYVHLALRGWVVLHIARSGAGDLTKELELRKFSLHVEVSILRRQGLQSGVFIGRQFATCIGSDPGGARVRLTGAHKFILCLNGRAPRQDGDMDGVASLVLIWPWFTGSGKDSSD